MVSVKEMLTLSWISEELKDYLLGDRAINKIFTLGNSEFPVSWENEIKLWTFLETRAALLLKTYKTTSEVSRLELKSCWKFASDCRGCHGFTKVQTKKLVGRVVKTKSSAKCVWISYGANQRHDCWTWKTTKIRIPKSEIWRMSFALGNWNMWGSIYFLPPSFSLFSSSPPSFSLLSVPLNSWPALL